LSLNREIREERGKKGRTRREEAAGVIARKESRNTSISD